MEDLSSELEGLEKRLKDSKEEKREIERGGITIKYEAESVPKGLGEKLLCKIGLLPKEPNVRLEQVVLKGESEDKITPERGEKAKGYLNRAGHKPVMYEGLDDSLKRIQWKRDGELRTIRVYDGNKQIFVSEKDHPKPEKDHSFRSIPLGEVGKDILPVMKILEGGEIKKGYPKLRKLENRLGGPATSRAKVLSVLTFLGGYGTAYTLLRAITPGTAYGHNALYELISGGMAATALYRNIKKKLKHKVYGRTD